MKYSIIFCLFILIPIVSCKKKDNSPPPSSSNNSGNPQGNNNQNGNGPISCDALFEITRSYLIYNGTPWSTPSYSSRAFLCAQAINNDVAYNYLPMGNLYLNGIKFAANYYSANYYQDTTNSTVNSPYIWNITGSSNISAQVDTANYDYPTFSGYSQLPDSLSKSVGGSFTITGLNKCDFFYVNLYGPTGSQYLTPKLYPGNTTTVNFSASELSGMATGNNGMFTITFHNDNINTKDTLNLNFRMGITYQKINFKIVN